MKGIDVLFMFISWKIRPWHDGGLRASPMTREASIELEHVFLCAKLTGFFIYFHGMILATINT